MAMNHWCLHRKHQEFAVVGTSKSAHSSSANGGSEPSNLLLPNMQLEALAESLTRAFRFLVEKRGRPDREKTRLQDAFRRLVG